MDLETYTHVLSKRGEDPHEVPNDLGIDLGGDNLTRADIAFRKDLIRKKVVWYNEQKTDWHAFLKNYHPLYSICTAPPQHPFSRRERLVVFICDIGFASILSIFVAMVTKSIKEGDDGEEQSSASTAVVVMVWQIIASVTCGLIKTILNGVLKFIAICPCCQTNRCGNACRCFWECLGHCLMCLWLFVVILFCAFFVWMASEDGILGAFVISFIINNVSSWIFSFCLLSFCFKMKWKAEKRNEKNKLEKLKVTFIDYEKYEKGNDVEGQQIQPTQQLPPVQQPQPPPQPLQEPAHTMC